MDLLIKRYSDGFDLPHGGGIKRAPHHLSAALREQGAAVHWYTRAQCADAAALLSRADQVDAAAVLPLVDHSLFCREAAATPPALPPRVVGAMTRGTGVLPRCDPHAAPRSGECVAAPAHPGLYAADMFFSDEPWTHRFPRHRVIPWAVAYLPQIDYRDRCGPVPLQAGKSHLKHTVGVIEACRANGVSVRVVSSGWSALGAQAETHVAAPEHRVGGRIVEDYHLERDHAPSSAASVQRWSSAVPRDLQFPGRRVRAFRYPDGRFRVLGHNTRVRVAGGAGRRRVPARDRTWHPARTRAPAAHGLGLRDMAAAYAGLVSSLRPALHASTTRTRSN